MPRTETLRNVPDASLAEVVEDFKSDGASVTTDRQPDGRWTVTATFSDETQPGPATRAARKPSRGGKRSRKPPL